MSGYRQELFLRLGTSTKQISKSIMTIHILEKQEAKQAKPVEAHSVNDRVYILLPME